MMLIARSRAVSFGAVLCLALAGWSSLPAAEPKLSGQAEWDSTVEAAKKEGKVTVYFWQGGNLEKVIDTFQKKYPEIRLDTVGGRGSSFIVRITTEIRAGKHLADICICGVTSPYKVLYEQAKALEPIKPAFILSEVREPSKWWQGKHHFQDPEGQHIFAYRGEPAGTRIFYNTNLVKPADFKSYWDILDPKWKGKILAIDPNESSGGWRIFYYNPQLGHEFVKRLFTEMEIVYTRDIRQATNWLGVGKFPLGLFLSEVPEAKQQGLPVDELPEGNMKEPTSLYSGANGTIAMMKQAPHPNAAKVFVNWFLSREGQIAFQEIMNTPLDQAQSMREDIPKDPIPVAYRRKPGVNYIPMFTPERMDAAPLLQLFKDTAKK